MNTGAKNTKPDTEFRVVVFPTELIIPGNQIPNGRIRVSGAKNAGTRLLAAAMLTDDTVLLRNFPAKIVDAQHKINFLRKLGFSVTVDYEAEEVSVQATRVENQQFESYRIPIRTTYLLAPGLIARNGVAKIPYPEGCNIGSRGYDLHVMVWEKLGAKVIEREDHIEVRGSFKGANIEFPISTVGGTETVLLSASIAKGSTEVHNAYITPEVSNLIELLRRMGADIEVVGNSFMRIGGRNGLLEGARINVMPDRIEALTWIVLAVLTGGTIRIDDIPFEYMEIPLIHLAKSGVDIFRNSTSVIVSPECVPAGFVQPFEVSCGTHPGVISDMQPFFVLLGMKAAGISRIYDYRYPNRIGYIKELDKFCPSALYAEPGRIEVKGVTPLFAADVLSTDLRGSMALIMAALAANGTSRIRSSNMALRGYNNLLGKFSKLGLFVESRYEQDKNT